MRPLTIQPIPYQGSKRQLAPSICNLFPEKISTLYEPFAGSAAVTLYAATHDLAESFILGDAFKPLIDLWFQIINAPEQLATQYSEVWSAQFSKENHFNEVRSLFNKNKDPVLLLYLIARCVKNAVRFNSKGEFSQSADKRRNGVKPERVYKNSKAVSDLLKGRVQLFSGDFKDCIADAKAKDLIYMDPPYQGTSYGPDKRYASGVKRESIIEVISDLDQRSIPYILSYDGKTGEKSYGEPLPESLNAERLEIDAGRSSQATINGLDMRTIESLYVSKKLGQKTLQDSSSQIELILA